MLIFIMGLLCIFVGMLAGILSGLFGLGGGVVIVPALTALFTRYGINQDIVMHLAIATSMATMVLTTSSVILAHHKRRAIHWPYFKALFPGMVSGAMVGAVIAKYLSTHTLQILFAVFCLGIAIQMLFKDGTHTAKKRHTLPALFLFLIAFCIGVTASLLGIGGGIVLIPLLMYLGLEIRQAMATSVTCVLPTAVVAALSFMIAGWHAPGLPAFTLGFVYWPLVLLLGIGSFIGAPLGVRLVHYLPIHMTQKLFAGILLFVAWKMMPVIH